MGRKKNKTIFLLPILLGIAVIILYTIPLTKTTLILWDSQWRDSLERFVSPSEKPKDLVLVGIDDASLLYESHDSDSPTLGAYPWPRQDYALLLDRIIGAGARLVIFDVYFHHADLSNPSDARFAQALEKYQDQVVLASRFGQDVEQTDSSIMWMPPAPEFLTHGTGTGFVNVWSHPSSHSVRECPLSATLSQVNGSPRLVGEVTYPSLVSTALQRLQIDLPNSEAVSPLLSRMPDGTSCYPVHSVVDLFDPNLWENKYDQGEFFRDKVILIGPTSVQFKDLIHTPSGLMHGAEYHLQTINAVRSGQLWTQVEYTDWRQYLPLILGASLAWIVLAFIRKPITQLLAGLTVGVALIATSVLLAQFGLLLVAGLLPALLILSLVLSSYQLLRWHRERLQRQKTYQSLSRHMTPKLAKVMVNQPEKYEQMAKGVQREAVILFADLSGFTGMSETTDSDQLVPILNQYLRALTEVVFEHQGTLDKYIGDAVMATWGTLDDTPSPSQMCQDALLTAQTMVQTISSLSQELGLDVTIGVGVHYGKVVLAEVGSHNCTDFTVIGDSVNVAARLEEVAKQMGTSIIASAQLVRQLPESSHMVSLGPLNLKGRQETIEGFYPN